MDYLTFDELLLCWGHQLEKAHRTCMPRTLIVCEFPREISALSALIDETPLCFSKHGYGSSTAILFSNALQYKAALEEVNRHYCSSEVDATISAVTYLGTESLPSDDFATAARVSIEHAFKNMSAAKQAKTPFLCSLTDLLQAQ